jgi:YVTN family beta-propeller protein/probable HAF family extracellular repeat protein
MTAQPQKCGASILSLLATLLATLLLTAAFAAAQQPTAGPPEQFLTIDFPGATSTSPQTINNLGQIVGNYTDEQNVTHGFLLSAGAFTTIDVPGAISTVAGGINNFGQIVGYYQDTNQLTHGFSLNNGSFTTIDDPAFPGGTVVIEISDFGLIVGYGIDADGNSEGFTLSNKTFTSFAFPGARFTTPLDVNYNGSEIVGVYLLPSAPAQDVHGFTYINGVLTNVAFPNSYSTALNGVNNGREIVGTYVLSEESNDHVFLLNGSTFTNEDFPGAVSTGAADLNDWGQIVGGYVDNENVVHAYLETNGPFAYAPMRSANSVAVFDVTTMLQLAPIPVGAGPIGIGLSPDGSTAYVANYDGNTISAIDTGSQTVSATIQVGSSPLGVAVTPNGAFVYVANNFSSDVSVINTDSNKVIATVPVGSIPSFVAITPDGSFAYVTNQGSSNVSVVRTATNTVVATITVGADPVGLAITPDGKFVYVTVAGANSVAVISTASNAVVATIPVGAAPVRISITPDGSTAYVSNQNSGNVVSVINLATNTVITDLAVGSTPYGSAVTPDGTSDWVVDLGSNQISVISTATNKVTATLPLSGGSDIAIAAAPAVNQQITQPLSPTQPNTFNFGTNNFVVQYPAGSNFSGVNMTVLADEITQSAFQQRVSGTQFANATCIIYAGTGGNCVDYQVTCSNSAGTTITCPSEPQPTIAVQTGFTTLQDIVNPGFLTTPIGENDWQNIFTGFTDPVMKGRTKGFSEFVAIDLGATDAQGLGTLTFAAPLRATDPRLFGAGVEIPVTFQLASVINPGQSITDAVASLTLEMVADAAGKPQSTVVLALKNAFHYNSGTGYSYQVNTAGYAPGRYLLTVYGNAFAAQHVQFSLDIRAATTCVVESSSPVFSKGEALTLTAQVQPAAPATGTPTGSITFMDSGSSLFRLGTRPLVEGEATIKTVLHAPPDRQWVNAVYPGDNNFQPCHSSYLPEDYSPPSD